jgi:hypothetical protein
MVYVPKRVNEIVEHEWTSLKLLWEANRSNAPSDNKRAEIDRLFSTQHTWTSAEGSADERVADWQLLNSTEAAVYRALQDGCRDLRFTTSWFTPPLSSSSR